MNSNVVEVPLQIRTPDGSAEAFLYHPEGSGPWPGVIYYTDIGGIRQAPKNQAGRIAAEGYAVLAPNIFYRTSGLPVFDGHPNFGDEKTTKRIAELPER
jgi:carboxymethylenebutenolidase